MFTNNGMYSTAETVIILLVSIILTITFLHLSAKKAAQKHKTSLILDLGYDGYLRHKEMMKRFGIHVD